MARRTLLLTMLGFFVLGLVPRSQAQENNPRSPENLPLLDLLPEAISIIQDNYVEPVDIEKLVHGALDGMASSLDPYCRFLPPEAIEQSQDQTTGTFGGLGIEITKRDGFITVVSPLVGTPAYRAGLMAGDRIVKIDDEGLHHPDLSDVVSKLRGEPGTNVTLTIVRGRDAIKTFTMRRTIVKVSSIIEAKILEDSIGYVKVAQFQEKTAADLHNTLAHLEGQGMDALILDLRENPGGLLAAAVGVADLFIPGGHVIVSTKGRRPAQNREFMSSDPGTHPMYPLAVLVNAESVSGSEVVAGAIKDLRRGVLVGERTGGHGTAQTILRLKGGAAMRLTTAKYYTPGGASFQDKGIEPDISVPETPDQEMARRRQKYDAMEEALREAKEEKPQSEAEKPTPLPKEIKELTGKTQEPRESVDVQLQEAVRVLKALKALGTGNIPVHSLENASQ